MRFLEEYRDAAAVQRMAGRLRQKVTRPWTLMEICGGQTHSIARFGLEELLPPQVRLVHGPGCPVCVTPLSIIDQAIALSQIPRVTFCSFGDMLRVPGSTTDLLSVQARTGNVRVVYSPMDALQWAEKNPDREVVFFAVGFETTAPANAMAVHQAAERGIGNFSILVSHVLVPPAMEAILGSEKNQVQGFLAAGHVCTVMGYTEYEPLARRFRVPIVVTGFEPLDIMEGAYLCVRQLEEGRHEVENQYTRSVRREGNRPAQEMIERIFHIIPRKWRGLGEIPASGLGLRPEYGRFDAAKRFGIEGLQVAENPECISGEILTGLKKPAECPAFATRCTPDHPLGAPMVSTEGACAAYYRYRRTVPPGNEAKRHE